jgi:hypothetical protein
LMCHTLQLVLMWYHYLRVWQRCCSTSQLMKEQLLSSTYLGFGGGDGGGDGLGGDLREWSIGWQEHTRLHDMLEGRWA